MPQAAQERLNQPRVAQEVLPLREVQVGGDDRWQAVVSGSNDLRVRGSQGQPVAAPELSELRQYRALLASLVKSLGLPDEDESNSVASFSKLGNAARWGKRYG